MPGYFINILNAFRGRMDYNRFPKPNQYTYQLGLKGPVYMDVTEPAKLYNETPELYAVLNRKALMRSNVVIKIRDKKSKKEKEMPKDLYTLLQNPNPLKSQNEFLMERVLQREIYGTQYVYKNKPTRSQKYPSSLANISPFYIVPYLTGKYKDQTELKGIIKHYINREDGKDEIIETEKILYTKINDLDNPILGRSPLTSLCKPITNISKAYDYLNVVLAEMGALGILSPKVVKDGMGGALPMDDDEAKMVNAHYKNSYGIGTHEGKDKMRVLLTKASLEFQATSFPVKDMMLFETIDQGKLIICDAFGMNIDIFSSKNAKYENVKQAIIQTYQDTIIPETDSDLQSLGPFIGIDPTEELYGCFEHIPILKSDKKTGIESLKNMVDALSNAVTNQLITAPVAAAAVQSELEKLND